MAGVNDLQLNTVITLQDNFTSNMSGFANSIGKLHGMLDSLNNTMSQVTRTISTPFSNSFSNGLALIGRNSHRANIELNMLNANLMRTLGLSSRIPTLRTGGSRGLGGLQSGLRGIFAGVLRGIRGLGRAFTAPFRSLFSRNNNSSPLPTSSTQSSSSSFGGFSDFLKNNLVTALVGAFGSTAVLNQAKKLFEDATKQMTVHQRLSHLKFVENGDISINELKDKIFGAAMRSKTNYLDFATMIQSVGARAGGAFGSSGELIQFTEQLQKIFTTDSDMDASSRISTTVQLSRALLKGRMESRELNQVLYNTPSLIDLIAKALKKPETEIYKLASEGKITADVVKKSVFDNIDEINKKFLDMPDGWGEVMIKINNYAQHAFQGVYQKITDIFTADRIQKFADKIAPIFYNLAEILEKVIDKAVPMIDSLIDSFDNWFTNLAELTVVLGTVIGLVTALNAVMMLGPIGWLVGALMGLEAIIAYLNTIDQTSHTLIGWLVWGLVLVGEYIIDTGRIIFNIIAGVLIEIYRVIDLIIKFIGRIVQTFILGFKLAWTFIKSLFFNSMNYIFQGINSLAKGLVSILLDIVNGFLEPLESGFNAIIGLSNKIGGTNFKDIHLKMDKNGAINFFDDNLQIWKDSNKQYNNKLLNETNKAYNDYLTAIDKNTQSMIDTNKLVNGVHKYLWSNMFVDAPEKALNSKEFIENLIPKFNAPNSKISNLHNISTGFDKSKVLNDIKSNTDDIKRNTDFSKYLRELADRQSVNHFTSPTYNVKFDAQNTINSKSDIDDIVHNFSEQLRNALMNSTQGVYQSHGGAFA